MASQGFGTKSVGGTLYDILGITSAPGGNFTGYQVSGGAPVYYEYPGASTAAQGVAAQRGAPSGSDVLTPDIYSQYVYQPAGSPLPTGQNVTPSGPPPTTPTTPGSSSDGSQQPGQQQPGQGGGGGIGGYGGGGFGGGYDPYAQDPGIAAALSMANPQADQLQQYQSAQSPGLSRMAGPMASSIGAQQQNPNLADTVWVTVPVDKVEVANGKGTVTPVYASAQGYQQPPTGNAIPPTPAAGRP